MSYFESNQFFFNFNIDIKKYNYQNRKSFELLFNN